VRYAPYDRAHLAGVVALARALDWPSYCDDPDLTHRALTAPGSSVAIALDGETVVGLAQVQGDGLVQAHLSLVGVLPDRRRCGVARELVRRAFTAAGGKWLDLAAEPGSESFYRSFAHREHAGFRLYPLSDPDPREPAVPTMERTPRS
jgi:ribosomal protein S18 acetylase RimI-like enzyme